MVAVIVAVSIAIVVFAVAAVAVGRETHRLATTPPAPQFELIDAVEWITERLSPEIQSELSYSDVRDLVLWHLEQLERDGLVDTVGGGDELLIVDDATTIDSLLLRGVEAGRDYRPDHIRAVLDGELGYLQHIGAVGPLASTDDDLSTA